MRELKASLVDRRGIDNRRFSQLNILINREQVEAAFRQDEPANALVLHAKTIVVVTNDERVVLIDRVIKTRTEEHVTPRDKKGLTNIVHVEVVVGHSRAHEFVIVSFDGAFLVPRRN